jgi:hypothetical protein
VARRRWLAGLIPATLVAYGLLAQGLAQRAFAAFVGYETPFAFAGEGPPVGPPLTPRVVLVLVDGLGYAASRDLPFLSALRGQGADYECRIGLPSLSLPARGVMLTGAWAEIHGQPTNMKARPMRVEHLFGLARRLGLRTGLSAHKGTHTLFAPVDVPVRLPEEPETAPFARYEEGLRAALEGAREVLRAVPAGFAWVELHIADEAGHNWGAASAEYARAARLADDALRGLAAEVDLARETLVVVGDHGHVDEGGHGGDEEAVMTVPLVLAGRGVRRGAGRCRHTDLAPTLSALLGLPIPASNQGRPRAEALEVDDDGRLRLLQATAVQRDAFLARYARRLGEVTGAPPATAAWAGPGAQGRAGDLEDADARLARLRSARIHEQRARRLPRALLFAALPVALVLVLRAAGAVRGGDLLIGLDAGGLSAICYYLLFRVIGLRASLTAVNKDEWMAAFFNKDMALALGCAALAAAVAFVFARRRGRGPGEALVVSWLAVLALAYVFIAQVAVALWRESVVMSWHLPDLATSFGFYLDALALFAAAVGGTVVVLALTAWAWWTRRRTAG